MEKRYFKGADGLRLAATVGGDPRATPVLMLHGAGQTRSSWGHGAKKMVDRGYFVIALDARGHGDSGWAEGEDAYDLDHFVADLRAVAATLDRPPALVGASLGGMTSLVAIAESDTPLAGALVMVDVTPQISAEGAAAINAFMTGNPEGFGSLEEAVDAVAAFLPHRPRPKDGGKGLMRNLRHGKDGRLYWHWDPAFAKTLRGVQYRLRDRLLEAARHVSIPTLLVRGGNSEIVTKEAAAEFRESIPGVEVVEIAGAHHMVAGDRNDAFNRAVIDFLERTMPPGLPNPV